MAGYEAPGDFLPVTTADGSFTLRSATLAAQYHSHHGAVAEAMHVYIQDGLRTIRKSHVDLLDVGLGTGLNALLTMVEAERMGIAVNYHAIEPHPVAIEVVRALDHPSHAGSQERGLEFMQLMSARAGEAAEVGIGFRFSCSPTTVQELDLHDEFDLVYFDPFAPRAQPALWTEGIFRIDAKLSGVSCLSAGITALVGPEKTARIWRSCFAPGRSRRP